TVRDRTIAEHSKYREHTQQHLDVARTEMDRAVETMNRVLERHARTFVCGYEASMTLGKPYIQHLYQFLGISSEHSPPLRDGNRKYIKDLHESGRVRLNTDKPLTIGIVTRPTEQKWGGDLRALYSMRDGLSAVGHTVKLGQRAEDLLDCDLVFLSNTCEDQRRNMFAVQEKKVPFALVGFHEDFITYYGHCMGFTEYVSMCLQRMSDNGLVLAVEDLWENPEVITYYQQPPPKAPLYNVPVLRNAVFCLAASHVEARTMARDCPEAKTEVVLWDIGLRRGADMYSDAFLQLTGLQRGEYILQVGRVESRKNQLASVLATKDIDVPLVFIGTTGYQPWYELLVVNAAAAYRKAPTIFVSQEHPSQAVGGQMRILQMPKGERLSDECIVSAFQNCGLHLHPAFWEAPGYTYLEAAYIGVHTVASEWGALADYCEFGGNDSRMRDRFTYVPPWHLPDLEAAVRKNFGRRVDPSYTHPIFDRTATDVGREIDACIRRHFS
ncbi:MAG: hypothetical protein HYV26_18950, partial [Candidatus Hydrogenedentes bacterium]|nr:hypothetical protein [Candidatus Hydrogenedentota bacterium]